MSQSLIDIYQAQLAGGAIRPDADQARAVALLDELIAQLNENSRKGVFSFFKRVHNVPRGVYMYGGVGRGKSMVMDLFFAHVPDHIAKRRVHFHEFMAEIHHEFHVRRGEGVDAIMPDLARHIARGARLLCFDEFHVTDVADAMILGRLFTLLFLEGVVVVATSNWPPERLYEGGLQRDLFLPFIGLLQEKTTVIALEGGTDYRMEYLQADGSYFHPLGRAARKQAAQVFSHLTGGEKPYSEKLTVNGRTIKVKTARGVAQFSFAQLCGQPYGAEDYLMIARNYHTVFLEDVPRLTTAQRNEAKRLMILIDALYEQRTKLVMTADGPPEDLYKGHDHGFEFQRTVSRLNEMQSLDYIRA